MYATRRSAAVVGMVLCALAACGPGQPSDGPVSVRSAAALVSGAAPIYDDGLAAGWLDWSWGSTRNLANPSPVASGKASLAVTFQAWGGIYFRHSGTSLPMPGVLDLYADGGSVAGNRLEVRAVEGSTEYPNVILGGYCEGGTIPANAWTRCQVPFSVLVPAGTAVDGVILQEIDGSARPTMYFDAVSLVGSTSAPPPAPPAAPANLAASVAAGAVSLGWSGCAGATGYDVFRATSSAGPFGKLTSSPQAATTYLDAGVSAGSSYWYRVTASNAGGTSPPSTAVGASLPAAVAVAISPSSPTLDACTSTQLVATVTGAADGSVAWSVEEGAAGGSVDAAGRYTAPASPGTYHVVATSKAAPSSATVAVVAVRDHILSVVVAPAAGLLGPGGTLQFTAMVTTTCGAFAAQ